MMKKYLFLSTLLATLVGCTHEDLVPESSSISFSKIEASIDGSADTRVDMNWYQPNVDNKTLSWSDDDLIGVYSDEQDIEAFRKSSDSPNSFKGYPVTGSKFYAIYPYSEDAIKDGNKEVIHTKIGDWGKFPMIATSNSNLFQFKQVVGFIAINFEMKSGVETNPSTLIANDDKPLSGNGFIDLSANEPIFVLDGTDAKPEATHYLKGGYTTDDTENDHGVEIFPIPVGTYEKGFTLTMQVFDPETETWIEMEKATTKSITVGRGEYVNFTAFDGYELMVETRDAYLKHLEEIKEMVEGQKTTLKTIWDSLLGNSDGQHGPYPDSWEDENNLNSWEYVGVDREGWVTSLNIYGRQMNGHIPAAIGKLTHLRDLLLQKLELSGTIPDIFDSLPHLETLMLQDNQLEGDLPASVYNLAKLRNFNISYNFFEFTISKDMQQNSVMWQNLDFMNSFINPQSGREENGVWKQYHVDLEGAVSSITLNSTDVTLGIGDEFQLSIVGYEPADANISNVEWVRWTIKANDTGGYNYSNNDNVISISENGLISVNGYGEAKVRVRVLDGGNQAVWCNIHVPDAEQEAAYENNYNALMDFYNAMDGENWTVDTSNWGNRDLPFNQWLPEDWMIEIDEMGFVSGFNLYGIGVSGKLPASFKNFSSLNNLAITGRENGYWDESSHSWITSYPDRIEFPEDFDLSIFPKLYRVNLQRMNLEALPPGLTSLKKLETLDFNGNNLGGVVISNDIVSSNWWKDIDWKQINPQTNGYVIYEGSVYYIKTHFINMTIGQSLKPDFEVLHDNASNTDFVLEVRGCWDENDNWINENGNPTVIVDQDGNLKACRVGRAHIYAKAADGHGAMGEFEVKVYGPGKEGNIEGFDNDENGNW